MASLRDHFHFGERVEGFDVRVINEREARAAAGILFFFAFLAFMHAWLTGDFLYERLMIIGFLIELFVRVAINPRYAPVMILARWIVRNQRVEYVGAPQKRVAWSLGLAIAVFMYWLVMIENNLSTLNLAGCLVCVTFVYFESAFGICLGCWLYNRLAGKRAELCPGGTCEIRRREPIQRIGPVQWIVAAAFIAFIIAIPTLNLWNIQDRNMATWENFEEMDWESMEQ